MNPDGPDTPEPRVWVHAFDDQGALTFANQVLSISEENRQEPIIIYIDSYGGYVDSLSTMINVMDSVPNPFITIVTGKAMSCGAILFSHGDMRCVGPHARVMIHEISGGTSDHVKDIEVDTRELLRMNKYYGALLARNCGKTPKQLQALYEKKRDIYLTPKQAVEFGIADHVGIPIIDRHVGFDLRFHRSPARRRVAPQKKAPHKPERRGTK